MNPDNPTENALSAGIYLHVPFCAKKCPYCDFYSIDDLSLKEAFIEAVVTESALSSGRLTASFDTVYIGGGTPSLLAPDDIDRILEAIRGNFKITPDAEITMEINPGTIDRNRLKALRMAEVNRLNIGAQSFLPQNLDFLGRIHSTEDTDDAIRGARTAGFENIGIDMIYGLPGQDSDAWRRDLERALSYRLEHFSCYILTYEAKTPMDRRRRQGLIQPLPDPIIADLFQDTIQLLEGAGYGQYEISNFSRTAMFQSRHNIKYWTFHPYLGLGPSAHSYIDPERWWNHRDLNAYLADVVDRKLPVSGRERLSSEQQIIEAVYLGLRLTEGIDLGAFESRFELRFADFFAEPLGILSNEGLLEIDEKQCRLTLEGQIMSDSVAGMLIGQIP